MNRLKMLIRIISLICVIYGSSLSQNVPDSVFNYTYEQLQASRDSVKVLRKINVNEDSVISNLNNVIENDSIIILNYEDIIKILKNKLASIKNEIKLISFKGFYLGLSAMYQFNDSILTKTTVISGMKYDLTSSFKFTINGNIDVSGIIGIPLRSEKFYLKASVEYKLF